MAAILKSPCDKTWRVYGPCASGGGIEGAHSTGPMAHVDGAGYVYCPACCPSCAPVAAPMDSRPVEGVQGGLFA